MRNIREQIKELEQENILLKQLATRSGFFDFYFKELGKKDKNGRFLHRTNYECFDFVNEKYYSFFGEYRFSTMNSFRACYNKYLESSR